jgi:hypothetical protein
MAGYFFSSFKRGKAYTSHHGETHLHRYLAEFAFCYKSRYTPAVTT